VADAGFAELCERVDAAAFDVVFAGAVFVVVVAGAALDVVFAGGVAAFAV
jgi:hypothetical protein